MDPSSNFYNYRTALRGAAQRSLTAHSSREKVCSEKCVLLVGELLVGEWPCFTLTREPLPGAVFTSSDLREVRSYTSYPLAQKEGEHRAVLSCGQRGVTWNPILHLDIAICLALLCFWCVLQCLLCI